MVFVVVFWVFFALCSSLVISDGSLAPVSRTVLPGTVRSGAPLWGRSEQLFLRPICPLGQELGIRECLEAPDTLPECDTL